MSKTESYAFLPGSGMLYSGAFIGEDEIGLDGQFMAEFERDQVSHSSTYQIQGKNDTGYQAKSHQHNGKTVYRLADKGARSDLREFAALKASIKHYEARAKGQGRMDPTISQTLQNLYQEYKAAIVDSNNTQQLTIVQFVNQIVGNLEQSSFITTAFKNIPLDKLRGKIPEMGWPPVNLQVDRLNEPVIDYAQFGQTEFRIKRNDVHIYISREDRMEASIDPFATSIQQGNIQIQRARELLALKELSNLSVNGTYGTIPDMTATTSNTAAPRATNDAPYSFVNAMVGHFNKYFNYLKYFIWNPLDYRIYLSNWFTHAYTQVQVPEGFGVVPFFGLEKYGAVAIISPYVPNGFVYSVAQEGAYELDGPKIVDSEYDAKKFADYNIVHDFVGYKIVNPVRFGEKLSLAGITPGTEITTDHQIYNLLAPPSGLVSKNANA